MASQDSQAASAPSSPKQRDFLSALLQHSRTICRQNLRFCPLVPENSASPQTRTNHKTEATNVPLDLSDLKLSPRTLAALQDPKTWQRNRLQQMPQKRTFSEVQSSMQQPSKPEFPTNSSAGDALMHANSHLHSVNIHVQSAVKNSASPVAIENIQAFAKQTPDLQNTVAKRSRKALTSNPRAWSSTPDSRCSIYTIRAFLGDPDFPLPKFIRNLKIGKLQDLMRQSGFVDLSGNKDALLRRFQTEVPFVEFRMDGRECLQRMLVVCLNSWGYSDTHSFRATMPHRGGCPWGAKCLGDLDCLSEMKFWGSGKNFSKHLGNKCDQEKWISRTLKNKEVNRATLEALLAGRMSFEDRAPFRTIEGSGSEPGAVGRCSGREFSNDVGGSLSLNECQLVAGDRVSMLYDFDAANTIIFKIVKIDREQLVLPEVTMLSKHATRAHVDQRGGYPVIGQPLPLSRKRLQYADAGEEGSSN